MMSKSVAGKLTGLDRLDWLLAAAQGKVNVELFKVVVPREGVAAFNYEFAVVDDQWLAELDVLGADEVFGVRLAGLVERKLPGQLLAAQHHGEWDAAAVCGVDFLDLDGVVSQVVVEHVSDVGEHVKLEHLQEREGGTLRSFSRNCFCEVTRPPPSLCSR